MNDVIDESSYNRKQFSNSNRWVVKIGSSLISGKKKGLDNDLVESWSEQIIKLRSDGVKLALVSSGAVSAGMERMQLNTRPADVARLRALAAIGQPLLVHTYESIFSLRDIHTALLLLTHEDFHHRSRYLNMRATLTSLLGMGVIPILNENDPITDDEIRFGDNDILAALAADLISATVLVILTDREGWYDKNPSLHLDAKLIPAAFTNDKILDDSAEGGGHLGMGGMVTKLKAARYAARSGCVTIIANGRTPHILEQLRSGVEVGTVLIPPSLRLSARKRWIYGQQHAKGVLHLDQGAVDALTKRNKSLLLVGVREVSGHFKPGDIVSCQTPDGYVIAYGVSGLSSDDAMRLKGMDSEKITKNFGDKFASEIIHRNDLALKEGG